jgi:DNA topoisomerase-2
VRFTYYQKRKARQLQEFKDQISFLGNKKRFLTEVINEDIILFEGKRSKSEDKVSAELEDKKYDKINDSYDYLLRMQIRSFTPEKIASITNDIESLIQKRDELEATSEKQLWINDLDEFESAYKGWLVKISSEKVAKPKARKGGKSGKRK